MAETGELMAGLTIRSLKRNPRIIPLLGYIGLGGVMTVAFVAKRVLYPDWVPESWRYMQPVDQLGHLYGKTYAFSPDVRLLLKGEE